MSVLHSQIDTRSEVFQRNREAYDRQRAEIAIARDIVVAVVEAMKMENQILAPFAGVVREVRCSKQETVIANQVLVVIGRDEAVEAG